eukprot:scaffold116807_cov63-Phaeocystis_antarctica.AAC.1
MWRTVTPSLPPAPKVGQCRATGSSRRMEPSSSSRCTPIASTALDTLKTLKSDDGLTGRGSAVPNVPAATSARTLPCWRTATCRPTASPRPTRLAATASSRVCRALLSRPCGVG